MRIRCLAGTDTLWIELRGAAVSATRDLDEDTPIDVDAQGRVCAITLEHASQRTDVSAVRYEQVPA